MRLTWFLIGLGLVVYAYQFFVTFLGCLRARTQRFRRTLARFEEVPPHVFGLVAGEGALLAERGFELVSPVRIDDFGAGPSHWGYHLVHRALDVHAYVRTPSIPWTADSRMVVLEAFVLDAGRPVMLAAVDSSSLPEDGWNASRHRVLRPERGDTSELLDELLATRTRDGRPMACLDDEAALDASTAWNETFDTMATAGDWIAADEADLRRPTVLRALRYAVGARFPGRYRAKLLELSQLSATREPAPIAEEVAAFLRVQPTLVRSMPRRVARAMMGLGLLLSIAIPAAFGRWDLGVALTSVVALHELGHALAMRLAGYRDVRVYFLPLIGGATAGDGRGASIHREALVLLAGPIPGLVLAIAAFAIDVLVFGGARISAAPVVAWAIWLSFALNYLNLLPALPLDGGRLVHRIVAGHPSLEMGVRLTSGAALLAVGVWAGDPMSAALGGWLFLLARRSRQLAQLERRLRTDGADRATTEARLAACFAALEGVRGWGLRAGMVHQLDLRLAAPVSSVAARAGWATVYALCLGLVLPISWLWQEASDRSRAPQPEPTSCLEAGTSTSAE